MSNNKQPGFGGAERGCTAPSVSPVTTARLEGRNPGQNSLPQVHPAVLPSDMLISPKKKKKKNPQIHISTSLLISKETHHLNLFRKI